MRQGVVAMDGTWKETLGGRWTRDLPAATFEEVYEGARPPVCSVTRDIHGWVTDIGGDRASNQTYEASAHAKAAIDRLGRDRRLREAPGLVRRLGLDPALWSSRPEGLERTYLHARHRGIALVEHGGRWTVEEAGDTVGSEHETAAMAASAYQMSGAHALNEREANATEMARFARRRAGAWVADALPAHHAVFDVLDRLVVSDGESSWAVSISATSDGFVVRRSRLLDLLRRGPDGMPSDEARRTGSLEDALAAAVEMTMHRTDAISVNKR